MRSNYSNIESLRAKLKSMDRSFTKAAYLGGDGNDQTFEQSFSDIAHAYLQDKAPSLVDYEQGFQVIERSDDDTKAVGVIGFKVNGMQLYAPVFFIRGQIKGHELLYIADSDTFVPLKEAWLNEIFRRKQITIGDPISRSSKGLIAPDLQVLANPPSKTASYYPQWLNPAVKNFCKMAGKNPGARCKDLYKELEENTHLEPYVKLAGGKCAEKFMHFLKQYPLVKCAFNSRYHGLEHTLEQTIENTKRAENSILKDFTQWNPGLHKSGGVQIVSMSFSMTRGIPGGLSDSEKARLISRGFLVQDSRSDSEVSKIVSNNEDLTHVTNPTQTGIYDVLVEPHAIRKMAVIFYRTDKYPRKVMVVDCTTGKPIQAEPKEIWCSKEYARDEYIKWLNKQRTAFSIPETMEEVLLINDRGAGFGPYRIKKKFGPSEYKISGWDCNNIYMTINRAKGSTFQEDEHGISVPATYHIIALTEDYRCKGDLCQYDKIKAAPFRLTTAPKYKEACYRGAEPVKLMVRNGECAINNVMLNSTFSGFKTLIEDYGLREGTANEFMKQAELAPYSTVRFFIKRAEDPARLPDESLSPAFPSIMDRSNDMMGFPGSMAPNGAAFSRTGPEDNREAYEYHPDSPYPAEDAKSVEQAIQNGQKEVFDVSMLKQLLTNADTDTQVDKLLARLTKGMNSVGRLLFLYYWKGDQFEKDYGPQKLPELEGSLRKAFEVLGDIILFLKRNKVTNLNFEGSAPIDLSDNED